MLLRVLSISFSFLFFNYSTLSAQCNSCSVTINGNDNPSSTISNNAIVCISGDRTSAINFNNSNGVVICISEDATVNASFNSLSSLSEINNYGTITVGGNYNGNWTINNYGVLNFNSNINSGKVVNNFSTMNVSGSRSVNGTLYSIGTLITNNSLTFNGNSTGTLNGVTSIRGNVTFNGNASINGITTIRGSVTFNGNSNVTLSGATSIGGAVTVNSNVGLAGSVAIGGSAAITSNAGFFSINSNQCNNITVSGTFSSNGAIDGKNLDYGGTGSSLFVNKAPSGNSNPPLSGGAVVGSCSSVDCLEVVQISASNSERDIVYIFKCSGVLELPEVLEGEEIIDAMSLIVAGGGGGGKGNNAGSGGAGGVYFMDGLVLQPGTEYQVIVGGGGRGSLTNSGEGIQGGSSSFFGLTSSGGGGGSSSMAGSNGVGQGNGNHLGSEGNGNIPMILNEVESFDISEFGGGGEARLDGGGSGRSGVVIVRVSFKVLPVEFLDIKVEYESQINSANLTWSTAKEWENSHFEIERSTVGIKGFEKIGEIQGMGWKDSITEYTFSDKSLPLTGGSILYRLKQVDFNGNSNFSKIVSISVPSVGSSKGVWRAYPNPTNGQQLRINLSDKSQYDHESISFRIVHPSFISETMVVQTESSLNDYLAKVFPSVPSGVFVVEIAWGQKIEHIKVMK